MATKRRLADLKTRAERRPTGQAAFILAHGKIEGDMMVLDDAAEREMQQKFMAPRSFRFHIAHLQATAGQRPPGYVEFVLARGKVEGDTVILDDAAWRELREKFPPNNQQIINIEVLKAGAAGQPEGYVEYVLAHGKINGRNIHIEPALRQELRAKFPTAKPARLPEPTLTELAANFGQAMSSWVKAGFKVVDHAEYERRHAICLACEFWRPDARLGLGKCKKCGCSRFKLWLTTSKCPDKPPRW